MNRGRFAPSPTGPLHAGSLVAALASWLDVRAHGGQWLVRFEDVDTPRCIAGMQERILQQLTALGLLPDAPPQRQIDHTAAYQLALEQLVLRGQAYACMCSRQEIKLALARAGQTAARGSEMVYPGTCRNTTLPPLGPAAWRMRTDQGGMVNWADRRLGAQSQDVALAVGDFPLKRADGCFTYQLAVVVDDAAQGITHVVRGEDLADNTARQILLQRALALPTPRYLHTPLVRGADGEKLSKQNGAKALDTANPLATLCQAAAVLGLAKPEPQRGRDVASALASWVREWRQLYNSPRD